MTTGERIAQLRRAAGLSQEQLAEALEFPDWYGENLDALYDCLTDLGEPVCLTVREPQLLPALERVLEDAAGENPLLEVWMSQ